MYSWEGEKNSTAKSRLSWLKARRPQPVVAEDWGIQGLRWEKLFFAKRAKDCL